MPNQNLSEFIAAATKAVETVKRIHQEHGPPSESNGREYLTALLSAWQANDKPKNLYEIKILDPAAQVVVTSKTVIASSLGEALDRYAPDPAEHSTFEITVRAVNIDQA